MILRRIYTNPKIFDVSFDLGINYIYGEKKDESSLNGIGKSLFLDFIDFCLLSHYELSSSGRLKSAYFSGLLEHTSVTLEFTINAQPGHITRSFSNPKVAFFNWDGNSQEYEINDLRVLLGEMLFGYPGYSGIFNPEWYRRLISFYIKIQKYSDEKFSNPLRYAKDLKVHEIPVYLFYLMHINNELPSVFSSLMITKKNISDSISTIKAFISKAYGVRDLAQVRQRIEHLERDISEVDQNIKKLFLLRNYDKSEAEADALTAEIKNLYYENASAKRIIEEYDNSLASNEGFSPSNVERIYNAVSNELGSTVKKSLEDAISFRRSLSSSRKQFIKATLEELRQSILKREKLIEEKEEKRRLLLNNLYATTAYSDLASAYQSKSGFQSQKDELISQTRLLNDLNSELQNLKVKQQSMIEQYPHYLSTIQSNIDNFNEALSEVFNSIYPEEVEESLLLQPGKNDNLLNLKFWEKVKHSHGKNIGRTLVFDFAVLLNNMKNKNNFPRFLIHDGIFDSLDKSHLIKTYEFIERNVQEGIEFQYITTINEFGVFGKNFGSSDKITPQRMKKEAKIIVSPKNKLLKADFYPS